MENNLAEKQTNTKIETFQGLYKKIKNDDYSENIIFKIQEIQPLLKPYTYEKIAIHKINLIGINYNCLTLKKPKPITNFLNDLFRPNKNNEYWIDKFDVVPYKTEIITNKNYYTICYIRVRILPHSYYDTYGTSDLALMLLERGFATLDFSNVNKDFYFDKEVNYQSLFEKYSLAEEYAKKQKYGIWNQNYKNS